MKDFSGITFCLLQPIRKSVTRMFVLAIIVISHKPFILIKYHLRIKGFLGCPIVRNGLIFKRFSLILFTLDLILNHGVFRIFRTYAWNEHCENGVICPNFPCQRFNLDWNDRLCPFHGSPSCSHERPCRTILSDSRSQVIFGNTLSIWRIGPIRDGLFWIGRPTLSGCL